MIAIKICELFFSPAFSVMDTDGKRIEEGEGSSGVKKLEVEDCCEVDMRDVFSDPTVKAPPHRPAASEPFPPNMITQQVRFRLSIFSFAFFRNKKNYGFCLVNVASPRTMTRK